MEHDPTQALLASWSGNADAWTRAVREGRIRSRRALTDGAVLQAIRRCSARRLLDVGCGEGWLCRALAGSGIELTGVDASPALVEAARNAGGADFRCLSYAELIEAPQAAGDGFDVIVCNFSLLDDRTPELLAALAQIATPDATLLIQTLHPLAVEPPYQDGWRLERFAGFDGADAWQPMPWYFRTLESWLNALSPTWRLQSLEEPRLPGAAAPASLLLSGRRVV